MCVGLLRSEGHVVSQSSVYEHILLLCKEGGERKRLSHAKIRMNWCYMPLCIDRLKAKHSLRMENKLEHDRLNNKAVHMLLHVHMQARIGNIVLLIMTHNEHDKCTYQRLEGELQSFLAMILPCWDDASVTRQ